MQLFPSFPEFLTLSREAGVVPVWREFLFDTDTAVTAYAKLYEPPFGFLLESVVGGEQWARYSFLGSQPREAWRLKGGKVSHWEPETGWRTVEASDPLGDLDRRLRARRPARVRGLPRFWGGAVGFFGYDVVRHIERLPDPPPDPPPSTSPRFPTSASELWKTGGIPGIALRPPNLPFVRVMPSDVPVIGRYTGNLGVLIYNFIVFNWLCPSNFRL